MRLYSRTRSLS